GAIASHEYVTMTDVVVPESGNAGERDFLCCLFSDFQERGIDYAVMRNYQALPLSSGGSDVDIYVNAKFKVEAETTIKDAVASLGAMILGEVRTNTFYEAFVLGCNEGVWWGVCIEFYYDIFYNSSIQLFDRKAECKTIVIHNNIKVFDLDVGNSLG